MYHHFDENAASDMIVNPETFDMHMRTLRDAGYTAISFDMLIDHVENGTPLPEKPICITMDDGYLSNYTYAYPILEKYGMTATVFVIGATSGWTHYRDTEYQIIPYFSWEEAREMQNSGVMNIECHTYDMHHWAPYETGDRPLRENILPIENESEEEYEAFLRNDINTYISISESEIGVTPTVLAYPSGKFTPQSDKILESLGFKVTLTTRSTSNLIIEGNSRSLRLLGRFTVTDDITAEELLEMIK